MSYIGNPINSVAFLTDQFSGNASTTAFTMSVAPATTSSVLVSVSGVLQDPSTYSVSGTTLTFSGAPPSGTGNISVRYLGIPASGVATTAYRTVTEFTATAAQTTFSPPSYTVGFINVYRNGVRLGAADYTASNGTTVVLATGATSGDLVTTESFYVSSVVNAISATAGAVNSTYLADTAVTQSKLATGVAGTGPAFSAYKSASDGNQSITQNTNTKITYPTETFDTNNNYTSSTFTPTVAGYYQVNASIDIGANTNTLTRAQLSITKNGSGSAVATSAVSYSGFTGSECGPQVSTVVYCNGSTDYLEVYAYVSGTTPIVYYGTGPTTFNACMVRGA